ncbi:hypothetical protein TNCT_659501 [Trichonephila clavata]|uniref:Uncharacterized protein n=1 Tax=Trichonephila clavata TaxID=2740835 RepID=A0A8X6FCQ4_TRICU|nr:hypothetical protein TNCT_659501 [Trichonephila clavata]
MEHFGAVDKRILCLNQAVLPNPGQGRDSRRGESIPFCRPLLEFLSGPDVAGFARRHFPTHPHMRLRIVTKQVKMLIRQDLTKTQLI